MTSIKDIPDERIRKLAETLKLSGLAASETEAVRMATSMTGTDRKVTQNFEQKKDKTIMGLSHLHKEEPVHSEEQKPSIQTFQRPAPSSPVSPVHHTFVQEKQEQYTLEVNDEDESDEPIRQEILEPKPQEQKRPVFVQKEAPKPAPTQSAPQAKPAPTQSSPQGQAPKKTFNQMEESKVDLSKVFGFKK